MPDEMMQGEQAEDAALGKILELCQSGDPKALQAIAQIVSQLQAHNQQEESSMGAEGEEAPAGMQERVMQRIQSNRGAENA